jgi:hypothetical protein
MYLKEIEWQDVDWIHQAQYRDQRQAVLNMTLNYLTSYKEGTLLCGWTNIIIFHKVCVPQS